MYGAVVGAAIMQLGPNQSTAFQEYSLIFYGGFLIIGGVLLSGGLTKVGRAIVSKLDRRAGLGVVTAKENSGGTPELAPINGARLVVDGVSKAFGGNQALNAATLTAEAGKVTALIGPNGSGKTTMLNMICGFYTADAGVITIGDTVVSQSSPHKVARVGVARTFQTPTIPENITVLEAVASGRYSVHRASMASAVLRLPSFRRIAKADIVEAERVLELVGMSHLRNQIATSLPLGMRRMLEVARAVIAEPRVVLFDEVASGLDEDELERLADLIRVLRDAGATVVLVEHNFRLVLSLADEIVVLAQGQVIATGDAATIEHHPRVLSEYLGVKFGDEDALLEEIGAGRPSDQRGEVMEPILKVRNLQTGYGDLRVVWDVSFDVYPGQVTALLGRNGAGKTSTLRALSGLNKVASGTVEMDGADITGVPAHKRVRQGMAYVQEGKRVFHKQTVEQNLLLGGYTRKAKRGELMEFVESMYEMFPILGEKRALPAGSMSGGQQQMLAIGAALMAQPRLPPSRPTVGRAGSGDRR